MNTNPAFIDCAAAKALSPEQWVALHVPRYALAASAWVPGDDAYTADLRGQETKLGGASDRK
jgi:hypothetical protein